MSCICAWLLPGTEYVIALVYCNMCLHKIFLKASSFLACVTSHPCLNPSFVHQLLFSLLVATQEAGNLLQPPSKNLPRPPSSTSAKGKRSAKAPKAPKALGAISKVHDAGTVRVFNRVIQLHDNVKHNYICSQK